MTPGTDSMSDVKLKKKICVAVRTHFWKHSLSAFKLAPLPDLT